MERFPFVSGLSKSKARGQQISKNQNILFLKYIYIICKTFNVFFIFRNLSEPTEISKKFDTAVS